MQFRIIEKNNSKVAELIKTDKEIQQVDDALDLIGNADYQGARKIIIHKDQLSPVFYDLKTGLAGEILQKFSTYRIKMAIVGDFSTINSKSMQDFIRESNRTGQILFVPTKEEAIQKI